MDQAAGKMLTYLVLHEPLLPGAKAPLPIGGEWTPEKVGKMAIEAVVDDIDRVAEQNEKNNRVSLTFDIAPAR
jgi:hypothetical protein